jgi:hypothetical protein
MLIGNSSSCKFIESKNRNKSEVLDRFDPRRTLRSKKLFILFPPIDNQKKKKHLKCFLNAWTHRRNKIHVQRIYCDASCGVWRTHVEFLRKYKRKRIFDKTFTMNFVCCLLCSIKFVSSAPPPLDGLFFRSRRRHWLAEVFAAKFNSQYAFHLA